MNKLVFIAVAAAFASSGASAQSSGLVGGARAEATFGWDRTVLHIDGESGAKSGVTYGAEIGYDFPLSDYIIVGPYVGIDGASTKQCVSDGTESLCVKSGRNITVGARFGTNIARRTALYVKGGYSNGRITGTYTDTALPADNEKGGQNMDGFHVGTGVQMGLANHVYTKLEYNYTRYSTFDGDDYSARFDRHRVVVGVGVQF